MSDSTPAPAGKRVVIFGATGTVGAGALLECLDHPRVSEVVCVVRRPIGRHHDKLREVIHEDFGDFSALGPQLDGVDGCLWAIGIPQSAVSEERYREITRDYAVAAATLLHDRSPGCCMVFVSGDGADETGASRAMWARVKGEAENDILSVGFARAVVLRPAVIATRRGVRHSVRLYGLAALLAPLARPFGMATSTVEIGRAFVAAVLGGPLPDPARVRLNSREINALAASMPE